MRRIVVARHLDRMPIQVNRSSPFPWVAMKRWRHLLLVSTSRARWVMNVDATISQLIERRLVIRAADIRLGR